jgi:hypothetical protein
LKRILQLSSDSQNFSNVVISAQFWRIAYNVPLNRDVAGFGTEFSRQDRKCFGNKTPGKQKTSNACG